MKKCSKCGATKPMGEFYKDKQSKDGCRGDCKECQKARSAAWRAENPERHKKKLRDWYRKNVERAKEYQRRRRIEQPEEKRAELRRWYLNNTEKAKADAKKWSMNNQHRVIKNLKRWQAKNPDKVKEYSRISGTRRRSTPEGRLNAAMSRGMSVSLKGKKAGRRWENLVGYSVKEMKVHIERQFLPGMSWENYGRRGWHIDHIIPKSVFNYKSADDLDFGRCWSLKNLRPMWATENIRKGAKLDRPFQPSLAI